VIAPERRIGVCFGIRYNLLVVSARKSPSASDWLVYKIGGAKATRLGTVKAATMKEAIAVAAAEFGLPPARIMVQQINYGS
jgi:hypothetical protein